MGKSAARQEAPGTKLQAKKKLQIPKTKLQKNPKLQLPKPRRLGLEFGIWLLVFLWPSPSRRVLFHTHGKCSGTVASCDPGGGFGPAGWSLELGPWSFPDVTMHHCSHVTSLST